MTNKKYPKGIDIVVGAIIENDRDEILMVQSPRWSGGKWTVPGGHIEPGETVIETAIRETKEETGLDVEGVAVVSWGELVGSEDFHRQAHFIYFNCYLKVVSGELQPDPEELTGYKWLKPEEALNLNLAGSYRESITKFIEYKLKLSS